MAYDYHDPFSIPKITGANAPLHRDTDPNSPYYIERTLKNYLASGISPKKILLGIPTFGHSYSGVTNLSADSHRPGKIFTLPGLAGPSTQMKGFLAYYEIADMMAQKKLTFDTDPITNTAYGYHLPSQTWVSFDTPETVQLKVELAVKNGLGGVIFWSIDMDEYYWPPRFPNVKRALHPK